MKAMLVLVIAMVCVHLSSSAGQCQEQTKTFIAFSLKAAESRMREAGTQVEREILNLGYITRIVGLIVDPDSKDCILVGERAPSLPDLHLDDLVVMLRSVFLYSDKEAPGVTIDPVGEDQRHAAQEVRYFGHIEGTRVGLICFDADLLMKKMGLALQPPRVDGVRVYFDLAVDEAKETNWRKAEVMSRFWYYPVVARVVTIGDGVLLDHCELAVLTEVLSARVNDRPVRDLESFCDRPSERFASSFTDHFDELADAWPVISELRSLATLAAVSRGLAKTDARPDLDYWLREYQLPRVETPTEVAVLRNANMDVGFEVFGGVHLQSLSMRLKGGDLTAFGDAVLQGRPSPDALIWSVIVTPDRQIIIPELPMEADSAAEAYARADYLFRARRYDLAIACWFQVARAYPEMGEAYYRIGRAFERKGMMACAADYYTRALELDPFLSNVGHRSFSDVR